MENKLWENAVMVMILSGMTVILSPIYASVYDTKIGFILAIITTLLIYLSSIYVATHLKKGVEN